jgi:hypothetical protein
MKRAHALAISLAVAVAAVSGAFAAIRTTVLASPTTPHVPQAQIDRQNRMLDRAEAALRAQAGQLPPALPPVPAVTTPAAQPPAVVYRRAPAIVRVVPRHGEHEHGEHGEHEQGGELDD